jgi:hypothetical protein
MIHLVRAFGWRHGDLRISCFLRIPKQNAANRAYAQLSSPPTRFPSNRFLIENKQFHYRSIKRTVNRTFDSTVKVTLAQREQKQTFAFPPHLHKTPKKHPLNRPLRPELKRAHRSPTIVSFEKTKKNAACACVERRKNRKKNRSSLFPRSDALCNFLVSHSA